MATSVSILASWGLEFLLHLRFYLNPDSDSQLIAEAGCLVPLGEVLVFLGRWRYFADQLIINISS